MATRFRVVRQSVRFCKKTYRKDEFLPESFSERDLYRVLYPSRIEKVEVPDDLPEQQEADNTATPEQQVPDSNAVAETSTPATDGKGINQAEKPSAAPVKTTGASLSGQPVNKK